MSKKIVRSIVSGYAYNVMEKKGSNLVFVKEVISPVVIRSVKQGKEFLKREHLNENYVLVLNKTLQKRYEILESEFMKYAHEVKEVNEK